jgi:uncharacterized protein YbaR (Trm112 family)
MPAPPSASDIRGPEPTGEIDPRLLEVLVCPLTHSALDYDRAAGELISRAARLAYPIRNGVPVMLPEEARALDAPES